MTPVTNNIFLFSNAIKEGIKTDMKIAFKNNPSRAGFWWKTMVANFLPKIIMATVAAGYFGKKIQDQMNKVSEYDKTNYTIVPLGNDENDKAVYLRIPSDETGRFLSGLLWKMMPHDKQTKLMDSIFDVFSFGAGQFPNLTPSLTGVGALMQYMSGKNPYDDFRGRTIIPDTEFKAGPNHSFPIMLNWLVKNQGLGIMFPSYSPDNPTGLEKVLNAPFVSNILGRWIKVSSYGETETLNEVSAGVNQKNAVQTLKNRDILDKAIKSYQANPGDKRAIQNKLVKDIVGKSSGNTGDAKTKETNTIKKFNLGIIHRQNDTNINALIDASTNDSKTQLLKTMKANLSEGEFTRIYNLAKKEKIISDNVVKDFIKSK
jgi:hypothetical protein